MNGPTCRSCRGSGYILDPACGGSGRAKAQPIGTLDSQAARIALLFEAIQEEHGVTRAQLEGKTRARIVAVARQQLAYELRQATGLPFKTIGFLLGGRDHSTIMHEIKVHAARLSAAS